MSLWASRRAREKQQQQQQQQQRTAESGGPDISRVRDFSPATGRHRDGEDASNMATFGLGPLGEDGDDDDRLSQRSSSSRPLSRRVSMDEYYYSQILGTRRPSQHLNNTDNGDGPPTYEHAMNLNDFPTLSRRKSPPREEEGNEPLPPYSCSIAIENIFMRKMELESAVHKAHDRNWYKVFVRLQGTALCLHRVKTASFFPKQSAGPNTCADLPPGKRPGELLRTYNLQHADVGIAADYRKRLYVIRVRVETDQFLLSCIEIETYLLWLESLCAAINLAPPLDERKLPKEYTIPRARRRRARLMEIQEALVREQREIMRNHYPQLLHDSIPEEVVPNEGDELRVEDFSVDDGEGPELAPVEDVLRRPSINIDSSRAGPLSSGPAVLVEDEGHERSHSDEAVDAQELSHQVIKPVEDTQSAIETPQVEPSTSESSTVSPLPASIVPPARAKLPPPPAQDDEITPAPPLHSQPPTSTGFRAPLTLPSMITQTPAGAAHPSICPETGKWQPNHNWTAMYDRLYAKRCIDVLLNKSPRKTNLVIMQGKRWFIDWATGAVTRCDPPLYGELDVTGPWGLMPSNMIARL